MFLLAVLAAGAGASENAQHEDILRVLASTGSSGSSRGVCCLPRCGDGSLAATIAKNSALLVLATDDRSESVAAARKAALDTGLLGKRLFVDAGSPSKIPLSDDYADVVLIADLDDQALGSVSLQEIERVLSPELGRAIIGRAASAPGTGKLSRERLAAWASPAGDVQIREDADGLWAILRKPRKKGADNWSYWNHGPDNNPASSDTAYSFPDSLQWLGRPVQTGRSVLFLSAGGRLFLAFSGDYQGGTSGWRRFGPDEAIEVHEHELHAFQAYNGQLLWSHPLPASPQPLYGYSVWIAEPDKFYLAEGHDLVVLNAADGKELDRMRVCADGQEIVWLAMDHGKLYVLTGSASDAPEHAFHVFDTHIGKRLAAYDLAEKKQIWEHAEPTAIDGHAIGMCQGKICFFAGSGRAAALSAADGKLLWSNEKIDSSKDKPLDINPVLSHLICEPNAVSILNFSRGTIVLSPDDGHELWRHDRSGGFAMMFLGDRLLSNTMHKDNYCLDLLTGENPSGDTFGRSGCGRLISTPAYTIGQLGTIFDLQSHKKLNREYQKPECDVGNVIANGMRYGAPHYCRCPHAFRGIMAWNGLVQPTGAPIHPLEVGQTAEPPAISSTTADWTQYRRDVQHTGSSPSSVGREALKELWRYSPSSPYLPTAPTAVNDIVFVGGSDGSIRGIDAGNGHERWNYFSGGKIYFPPAFSDNRLFVGSSDGNLYCLGAANGSLQWRFRLAPQDQRMMVYDQLISRWPVNVNPVVEKGTVFAAAGLIDCEGVSVFALDSHSGKVKWSNETLGNVTEKRIGVVPMGGMTIAGNRVWLRGDSGFPAAFDVETGALPDTNKSRTKKGSSSVEYGPASMGKDIGIFAGRYLIDGGRRLFSEQSDRVQYQLSAFAMELSPDGLPHGSRIALGGRGVTMQIMPVWDDELFLTVVNEKLTAERAADLLQSFEAKKGENTVIKSPLLKKTSGVWTSDGHQINAMVLCRDAVLIAEGLSKETNPGLSTQKTRFEEWRLTALDRETGRELWHVALPSEPVYDGLAIDRNGRAIVSLSSGCVACYGR
jgi:outer membrane protein assembly factor BamB